MTDSMKFGPEWLRNLSETPVQPQPVRYQLAEFRYGREEMLALYSSSLNPPESLKNLPGLYVEKAQPPLALNTMTDEETRMWNRGINSDAVLRSGKGGEGRGAMRGAGGTGRGRGRGGTGGTVYYGRGGGIEPGGPRGPGGGYEDDLYSRPTRPFERSQSYMGTGERRSEVSWSERNGGEGRGGTRPTEVSNWRRTGRTSGEEDEWRPQKWSMSERNYVPGRTNSGGNWREEDSWDPMPHSKGNHHLPEWATEKNSEGGGTFDSSGAFRPTDAMGEEEERSSQRLTPRKPSGMSRSSEQESSPMMRSRSPPEKDFRRGGDDGGREAEKREKPAPSPQDRHAELPSDAQLSSLPPRIEKEPPPADPAPAPAQHAVDTSPSKHDEARPHPASPAPPPVTSQPPPNMSPSAPPQGPQHMAPQKPMMRSPLGPMQPPLSPALDQPPPPIHPSLHQPPLSFGQPPPVISDPLGLDEALSHMTDDIAADLVAKLMEDEENKDKQWYYRDPQGQVQGPFSCNEMAEWFESGYFTLNLMVRRACDPTYGPLGELIKLWGCIPFLPEHHKLNQELPAAVLNSHQVQENLIMASQYQQYQRALLLRQQQAALVRAQMHGKLPLDWIDNHPVPPPMVDQVLPPQYQPQGPGQPPVPAQLQNAANSNNLRALLAQMQQQTLQRAPAPKPTMAVPRTTEEISRKVSDFLRGLQAKSEAQQAAVAAAQAPGGPPPGSAAPGVMETLMNLHQPHPVPGGTSPIQNLLRQMQAQQQVKMQQAQQERQAVQQERQAAQQQAQMQQQQQQQQQQQHGPPQHPNAAVDSVWNTNNWNHQWTHLNAKGIKTEQQVLEEQLRAEDDRKREELRKQEEAQRKEAEEEEKAKQEMVASMMVEESMREMRKVEELARRRQEEEDLRRKQEASRRAEVERQRKGEEKRKKDEEKRKKEEEKKEKEKERLRAEEERKKKEAEEAKKRAAADVMAKVQRSQWCPPPASNTSILDIQRSEREQQQLLRDLQAQQAQQAPPQPQQPKNTGLQLKWTETTQRTVPQVESLDAIQAEQRQYLKQLEKEKAEREKEKQAQQQSVGPGALGSWSQGLTWGTGLGGQAWQTPANPVTNSASAPNVPSGGFWDTVGTPSAPQPSKSAGTPKPSAGPNQQQQNQQQQQQQQAANKEAKNKAKRDEMAVMKLFAVNSSNDEFIQWCTQTLSNLQSGTIDIPTFVTFLRDVESAEEVRDYIKVYLGEGPEALEFARQFIERRRSESRGGLQSTSPTPTNQDFQQVKGKNKKGKKGRMQRVDSRILNFSTTSASDRINIGDRQYPEFE